jgi:broad specificity phosphatase PhoE
VSELQELVIFILAATFRPTECPIGSAHAAHMARVRRKRPPASSLRRFTRERRRALKTLADAPRGLSEEVLVVAHGFSAEMLAGLVLDGLATVVIETKEGRNENKEDQGRTRPRGLTIEVRRIRITDAGRRMIEG